MEILGSYYELSMEFASAEALRAAVDALAACNDFNAHWQQVPAFHEEEFVVMLHGELTVRRDVSNQCVVSLLRTEDGVYWLDVATSLEVEAAFVQLAVAIYCTAPFQLAMIGEEITGCATSATLPQSIAPSITYILPDALQHSFSARSERLSAGLTKMSAS